MYNNIEHVEATKFPGFIPVINSFHYLSMWLCEGAQLVLFDEENCPLKSVLPEYKCTFVNRG